MNVLDGMILTNIGDASGLNGMYRVVQIFPNDNEAVLIEIPVGKCDQDGNTTPCYYATGFFIRTISELNDFLCEKIIKEAPIIYPPFWNMSDEAIREAYPPRKGNSDSSMLLARERRWQLIDPIIPEYQLTEASQYLELETAASAEAVRSGLSNRLGLDALHRYYAFGCIKNALLTNTTRCGAPGEQRIARNGKKLGRKNAAAAAGNFELEGKILTEEDRENLSDGWNMFVRPGTTISEAYYATSMAFYEADRSMKNGSVVVELLPAHQRPTEREFRYHGPLGSSVESAARRIMGEGEWLKNHRELSESARPGITAFGQLGSIDASPIDVNLVTSFDRLRPIGVGRGVFVTDVMTGLIVGWHVAIGGIGTKDANLAILSAAMDKSSLLQRYGLSDMSPDDFPTVFFSRIIADNGELRSIKGMDANVKQLGGKIDFIPSGRADQNSISESGHHVRHRRFDHKLTGTNKGRQRKRGEKSPIAASIFSHAEYCRLLIMWIHWYNTKQDVRDLLTIEMRRDNVKPTRIEIFRWLKRNGYVAGKNIDKTHLRAHLLPTFTASIQRNGLVLHRPGKEKKIELLHRAVFNDTYLAESGLIRTMSNGGKKHIAVSADPNDLACVYLFDGKGAHVIRNISNDSILVQEANMADLCAMNDVDRQEKVESASERDQAEAEMRSYRLDETDHAMRDKTAAQKKLGGGAVSIDQLSIRENQKMEQRMNMDLAVDRASGSRVIASISQSHEQEVANAHSDLSRKHRVNSKQALIQAKLNRYHEVRNENE